MKLRIRQLVMCIIKCIPCPVIAPADNLDPEVQFVIENNLDLKTEVVRSDITIREISIV